MTGRMAWEQAAPAALQQQAGRPGAWHEERAVGGGELVSGAAG